MVIPRNREGGRPASGMPPAESPGLGARDLQAPRPASDDEPGHGPTICSIVVSMADNVRLPSSHSGAYDTIRLRLAVNSVSISTD